MTVADRLYFPAKQVAFRKIGGRIVLVIPAQDKLMTLNETATAIWERLNGQTVNDIARDISDTYEVDFNEALADVLDFLSAMSERDIVYQSPTPAAE